VRHVLDVDVSIMCPPLVRENKACVSQAEGKADEQFQSSHLEKLIKRTFFGFLYFFQDLVESIDTFSVCAMLLDDQEV